jgi:hypothetical protein
MPPSDQRWVNAWVNSRGRHADAASLGAVGVPQGGRRGNLSWRGRDLNPRPPGYEPDSLRPWLARVGPSAEHLAVEGAIDLLVLVCEARELGSAQARLDRTRTASDSLVRAGDAGHLAPAPADKPWQLLFPASRARQPEGCQLRRDRPMFDCKPTIGARGRKRGGRAEGEWRDTRMHGPAAVPANLRWHGLPGAVCRSPPLARRRG